MSHRRLRAGAAIVALATATALGVGETAPAQDRAVPRPSLNLYGATGLIDMPSAEAQPDGQISASYSQFGSTSRRNFTFQVLPRVSTTLRYSTIQDWGRPDNPTYDLYDRSLDVTFQLAFEDRDGWRPAIALGFRDFLGTGVYSSEFLVASKTVFEDFTITGGLGWGRLAGDGMAKNPFCEVSSSMCERDIDFGEGGKPAWDAFFHGEDIGFFGGVEWRATDKFTLKVEYSPDQYERERRSPAADFDRRSSLNFGAEYRWFEGVTLGAYYMYGSELGFNVAVSGNPMRPLTPQDLGTGPLPVNARAANAPRGTGWANNPSATDQLAQALSEALKGEGLQLEEMSVTGSTVEIAVTNRRFNQEPRAIGRAARVLAAGMPASVETFRITPMLGGLRTTTVEIDRSDFEAQIDRPDAGQRSWDTAGIQGATPTLPDDVWRRDAYPEIDWSIAPAPYLFLLNPEEQIRLSLYVEGGATVTFAPGFSVSGRVAQGLINVPDDDGPSNTNLPPVRSEMSRYYAGYDPKLQRATVDYLFKLNEDTYARASAGYLERMFAGVSGEILWKPVDQSWGLGLELNYVAQRDYEGLGFSYYDYDVATGHASLYWDTGFENFEVIASAGRYLAGDWGGTLEVSRRFPNGWTVGGWATLTDVTEEAFGEGSFDKGIFLQIPFRWTVPFETRATNTISLTSVQRDGGAMLNISNRLYPIVRDFDRTRLEQNWGSFWQ